MKSFSTYQIIAKIKACIFTAGGTPRPYSPQESSSNCATPRVLIVRNMNSDATGLDI